MILFDSANFTTPPPVNFQALYELLFKLVNFY